MITISDILLSMIPNMNNEIKEINKTINFVETSLYLYSTIIKEKKIKAVPKSPWISIRRKGKKIIKNEKYLLLNKAL